MMSSVSDLDELKGLGILIEGASTQKFASGEEFWLKFIAQFPDDDIELNIRWIRSLFVTCISKSDQIAMGSNLIKSSVIFPGDIKKVNSGSPMIQIAYSLNLAHEFNQPLSNDCYYVQISARHFLSNLIEVEVS